MGKVIDFVLSLVGAVCFLIIGLVLLVILLMLLGGLLKLLWLAFLNGWDWLPLNTCGENEICQ